MTAAPRCLPALDFKSPGSIAQSLNRGGLSATPRTAARQAPLSFTISRSLLRLMSIESVVPSNRLTLCRPLLLLPSFHLSRIRVFSDESALHTRWPSVGASASASVLPMSTQDYFPLGLTGFVVGKRGAPSRALV